MILCLSSDCGKNEARSEVAVCTIFFIVVATAVVENESQTTTFYHTFLIVMTAVIFHQAISFKLMAKREEMYMNNFSIINFSGTIYHECRGV